MRVNIISNYAYTKSVNFRANNKQDERLGSVTRMIYRNRDAIINNIDKKAVEGKKEGYKPIIQRYDLPNTKNQAIIAVCMQPDTLFRHNLIAGAYSNQTDTLCSKNLLLNTSKRNIIDFLKTPDGIKEVATSILRCSDELDKDN